MNLNSLDEETKPKNKHLTAAYAPTPLRGDKPSGCRDMFMAFALGLLAVGIATVGVVAVML